MASSAGGGGFLAALRREGKINGSVVDDLAQLGAGRINAIPRAPVQVPTTGPASESVFQDVGDRAVQPPASVPGTTAAQTAAPTATTPSAVSPDVASAVSGVSTPTPDSLVATPPTTQAPVLNVSRTPLGALPSIIAGEVSDDNNFYQRTGRTPSASDKLLIQSRDAFFQRNGRQPTASELFYEAQRGVMQQYGGGPSIS